MTSSSQPTAPGHHVRLGHRASELVRFAFREARSLRMRLVTPEHFVLALCHERPNSRTAAVLERSGVRLPALYQSMVRELSRPSAEPVPGTLTTSALVRIVAGDGDLVTARRTIADLVVAGEPVEIDVGRLSEAARARLTDYLLGVATGCGAMIRLEGATITIQP